MERRQILRGKIMIKTFCDIPNCKREARNNVDFCSGFTTSCGSKKFKPFEKSIVIKKDLCDTHYKKWCKVIYDAFFGTNY